MYWIYIYAYYVHITERRPHTRHTHTKHENILEIYIHKYVTYIHIYKFIHVHTYHHLHTHTYIKYIHTYYAHITNTHPCTLNHVH